MRKFELYDNVEQRELAGIAHRMNHRFGELRGVGLLVAADLLDSRNFLENGHDLGGAPIAAHMHAL